MQEENENLKDRNANLRLNLATYDLPEVKKVLTDWRTGELQLQENKLKKYKQALEEIKEIIAKNAREFKELDDKNSCAAGIAIGWVDALQWVLEDSEDVENE